MCVRIYLLFYAEQFAILCYFFILIFFWKKTLRDHYCKFRRDFSVRSRSSFITNFLSHRVHCVLYQCSSRNSWIMFLFVESVRTLFNKLSSAVTQNLISSYPQQESCTNLQCFKICHCKISLIAQIQNTAILN